MKRCNICRDDKPMDEFHRHSSYADGRRSQCKECLKKVRQSPEWKAAHLARTKAWQKLHPEALKAIGRRHHQRHRNKNNTESAAWRAKNRELSRQLVADWLRRNPEANSVHAARRRTRLVGNGGSHTISEWRERLEYFGDRCAYCLAPATVIGRLSEDHIYPLALGGTNDIDNVAPACTSCNSTKGPRTLLQFLTLENRHAE